MSTIINDKRLFLSRPVDFISRYLYLVSLVRYITKKITMKYKWNSISSHIKNVFIYYLYTSYNLTKTVNLLDLFTITHKYV